MSREFKKEHGELRFTIPPNIQDKEIQEVRIHPRNNARFFEIEYIYEQPEMKADVDADKFLGVDLGLDNLASCVTSEGASFIIDGKQIKSYNRLYNKENARLQSIKDKQHIKGITARQYLNLRKRNARINHAMSTAARRIISYCIIHRIGNIVVGCNPKWKQSINLGGITNQNFVQIPHGKLREKLAYLCELYGIRYVEQEESYTSKASFFDDDDLPMYNADNPQNYDFSGSCVNQPRRIRVFWSGNMRVQTLGHMPTFAESSAFASVAQCAANGMSSLHTLHEKGIKFCECLYSIINQIFSTLTKV